MIIVDNIQTWGFDHAIRGMRNPMQSHRLSDSYYSDNGFIIGDNDIKLMQRLYKAGTEHRKYLRQIFVSMDITAPLYWWKQFDQYKIGVTTDSYSTMHKITSRGLMVSINGSRHSDLSLELDELDPIDDAMDRWYDETVDKVILFINAAIEKYNATKDKKYWDMVIKLLPESYNQTRTVTMNYENVMNMIDQRSDHKLCEWRIFCSDVLNELPMIKTIRM